MSSCARKHRPTAQAIAYPPAAHHGPARSANSAAASPGSAGSHRPYRLSAIIRRLSPTSIPSTRDTQFRTGNIGDEASRYRGQMFGTGTGSGNDVIIGT